jgi:short-subunit dehydrogenase involved in D-alanine esterification of teichoic acids
LDFMDITNRTVFIAGGTSGIGLGLARRFAAAGGTVIVGGRRAASLDGLRTVEIDDTYADLVAQRSQALTTLPGR